MKIYLKGKIPREKPNTEMIEGSLQSYVEHLINKYYICSKKYKKGMIKYIYKEIKEKSIAKSYTIETVTTIVDYLRSSYNKLFKYGTILCKVLELVPEDYSEINRDIIASAIAVMYKLEYSASSSQIPIDDLRTGGKIDAGVLIINFKDWKYINKVEGIKEYINNKVSLEVTSKDVNDLILGINQRVIFTLYKIGKQMKGVSEAVKEISNIVAKAEKDEEKFLKLISESEIRSILSNWEVDELLGFLIERNCTEEFLSTLMSKYGKDTFLITKLRVLELLFECEMLFTEKIY